jgi:hypothetical protein
VIDVVEATEAAPPVGTVEASESEEAIEEVEVVLVADAIDENEIALAPLAMEVTNVAVTRVSEDAYVVEFDSTGEGSVVFMIFNADGDTIFGVNRSVQENHNSYNLQINVNGGQADSVRIRITLDDADGIPQLSLDSTYPIPAWPPAPASDAKDITSFSLAGAAGLINGADISVIVPYGTDVTSQMPDITHSGVSISPEGEQDFSSPVQYTVTAEDDSTKTYTVTVTVAPASSDKDITSFVLAGVAGAISGGTITATVPYGTDVTALTPEIAHNGEAISPSGAQDFSGPVTYTVTAQDGSTKNYVVTATVATTLQVDVPAPITSPVSDNADADDADTTIVKPGDMPKTGDSAPWLIAILLLLVSGSSATLFASRRWWKN